MSKIRILLISSLKAFFQVAADLCESFMSRFGLIRWAYNKDPNTSNEKGSIGRWVFFHSLGQSLVRGKAVSYKIKDTVSFNKRWAKFRAYFECARFMKFNLTDLYEGSEIRRTWWSVLCSQISRFWVKQNDGTYLFSPGVAAVSIGNGSMPDARNVIFSSPSVNTLQIDFDASILFAGLENNDDTVQIMFIDQNGQYSFWADLIAVARSTGTVSYTVPALFGAKIYPAIKFRAGTELSGKVKGIFRFPQGMQPLEILR
jgi:hypothetical protein